jgi:hypothetical protein
VVLESFYTTAAQLCFTLLGLWWLVVQTRQDIWTGSAQRRQIATHISLYFLLPGSRSLIALISTEVISIPLLRGWLSWRNRWPPARPRQAPLH